MKNLKVLFIARSYFFIGRQNLGKFSEKMKGLGDLEPISERQSKDSKKISRISRKKETENIQVGFIFSSSFEIMRFAWSAHYL
jgi:hypothetical protein